jgi:N-acetylneuraminic acid mutarotase
VPDLNNAEASGVYAPNVNKLFVFGGDDPTTGTVVNTTRIYDIATNTWSTGAPMPDVRAFMGSGYFNGKIYLVGGYTTGNVDPSFGQVWEYDPVANTWNTSRMSMPATLGGPGFGIINGHMYIAGGRNLANTNLNTLYDYDIAANTWTTRANMPSGVNVPGSAVIGGKLWVFGGGNPFLGSSTLPTSGQTGVRAWFKRLFNPDTTNALQVYDPVTDSWTSGPTLNQQRSFPAGTDVGNTAVAVGGYTGTSTTASVEINVTGGGGCGSPTPTPTGTPSATPTCTPGGAGQITTLFASNNFGDPGGVNYYDLTVGPNAISITALDINTAETVPFTNVRVYILPGMTSQGNETNMALWTQVATGSGTGAGLDVPTHVTLSNPIPLNAGTLYGIAVVADPAITLHYTNGNGSNQNYSNADLALFLGSATNVPFTAPVFSPRVWNGTIYYSTGSCGSPTPTPTGTPSATPTCTPGGSPGPWSTASPYPIPDVRYGFAQTATHFYVFGGVSNGTRVPDVNRLDLATGMWESRAAMPFTSEAPTCALMASTGIVYCTEGDTGSGFASYNIATNTWTSLAAIPGGDHYGSASGAFNGKVFVAGGTTGLVSAVQVYDVATNTWSAGTAAPSAFLLAGYQQVGQFLYVVGGFSPGGPDTAAQSSVLSRGQRANQPRVPDANNTTTFRLDMTSAPGVWSTGPAFTQGRADFGVSYDPGTNKLYALGGDTTGGGFFDSTNLVDELAVGSWPAGSWAASPPNLLLPNRQANQAGFSGSGQIWSVGGLVGQTFQFLAEVQRRSNGGAPCGSPTATPTATATFTPTATATATATFTPTATATATFTPTATATITASPTATASPTVPPRPSPTPRPRPTPPPRVANCYASSNCTGYPKTVELNCVDCLMSGGQSWLDGSGCHTTCP